MERLPENPVSAIYGVQPSELVKKNFHTLEIRQIKQLTDWIKLSTEAVGVTEEDLRQPAITYDLFETYILSLFGLLREVQDIKRYAPDWTPEELEENAALFLSMALIRRQAAQQPIAVSSSIDGEEAAKKRKWKDVQDAIGTLKAEEDALVEDGESILSGKPQLLKEFTDDEDDGSFADAAKDVQRRIDFVLNPLHEEHFKDTIIDAARIAVLTELLNDAWAFFSGREGKDLPRTTLTLARDQSFTLFFPRLERMQRILRSAYRGNEEARKKIEGGHWKRLARLTRPRAKRKKKPEEIPPGEGSGS